MEISLILTVMQLLKIVISALIILLHWAVIVCVYGKPQCHPQVSLPQCSHLHWDYHMKVSEPLQSWMRERSVKTKNRKQNPKSWSEMYLWKHFGKTNKTFLDVFEVPASVAKPECRRRVFGGVISNGTIFRPSEYCPCITYPDSATGVWIA